MTELKLKDNIEEERFVISLEDLSEGDKNELRKLLNSENGQTKLWAFINHQDFFSLYSKELDLEEKPTSVGYLFDGKQFNFELADKDFNKVFEKGIYYMNVNVPLLGNMILPMSEKADLDFSNIFTEKDDISKIYKEVFPHLYE